MVEVRPVDGDTPNNEEVAELTANNKRMHDEFNVQRGKLEALYMQKEAECKKLVIDIEKMKTDLDEVKSQLLVAEYKSEQERQQQERKAQEEIALLQQLVQESSFSVCAQLLRSLEVPFEEELKALKEKLRATYLGSKIDQNFGESLTANTSLIDAPPKSSPTNVKLAGPDSMTKSTSTDYLQCEMCQNYELKLVQVQKQFNEEITAMMDNWKLVFSGKDDPVTIGTFLQRVENMASMSLEGDLQPVAQRAQILFTDRALKWFWRFVDSCPRYNWQTLKQAAMRQFEMVESDAFLKQRLWNRRQLTHESVDDYYEALCCLLERSISPIPEQEFLEIFWSGIRTDLRERLVFAPRQTVYALRASAKELEAVRSTHSAAPHQTYNDRADQRDRQVVAEVHPDIALPAPLSDADVTQDDLDNTIHPPQPDLDNTPQTRMMANWKLVFSGKDDPVTIGTFLQRVENMASMSLEGDLQPVAQRAQILFTDRALKWFWRFVDSCPRYNWQTLKQAAMREFEMVESDAFLKQRLWNRRQLTHESVDDYYEALCCLLERSISPISEQEFLEIFWSGIRTDLRERLVFAPRQTVYALRASAKELEAVRSTNSAAPHQTYNDRGDQRDRRVVAEVYPDAPLYDADVTQDDLDNTIRPSQPDLVNTPHTNFHELASKPRLTTRWNCRRTGHHFTAYRAWRKMFCCLCGKTNTNLLNCTNCRKPKTLQASGQDSQQHLRPIQ